MRNIVYIIIIIIKSDFFNSLSLSLSLAIRFYRPSSLVSILDSILYPHRIDECKFLLVGQGCVDVPESISELHLCVCPYYTNSTQQCPAFLT